MSALDRFHCKFKWQHTIGGWFSRSPSTLSCNAICVFLIVRNRDVSARDVTYVRLTFCVVTWTWSTPLTSTRHHLHWSLQLLFPLFSPQQFLLSSLNTRLKSKRNISLPLLIYATLHLNVVDLLWIWLLQAVRNSNFPKFIGTLLS